MTMVVERSTQTVNVLLQNGKQADVLIYRYILGKQKQAIMSRLLDGVDMNSFKKSSDDDTALPIPPIRFIELIEMLKEYTWADQNYKIEEIEPDSLSEVIYERFEAFLGNIGVARKVRGSESGQPATN